MAVTRRPSPATKNTALAVRAVGTPSNSASASIVSVPGVVDLLDRHRLLGSAAGLRKRAICWLAA